jgi:chitosanase
MALLKEAGKDPVMQSAQDQVFDEVYWRPAVNIAEAAGLKTALGHLVIYDTCIHSGPGMVGKIRAMFPEKSPANGGDEREWVRAYVSARRGWLAAFPNPIVQGTVYRPDAFRVIMDAGNWDLRMPLVVRGVKIS